MKRAFRPACFPIVASALAVLGAGSAALAADAPLRAPGHRDLAVFEGPPAPMALDIFGDKQKKTGVLRILTVDERMGYPRQNELVRVPLFFHEGECSDPNALQIVPAGGGEPIPYQAADIRRGAAGKVARMHAYFVVEMKPWERKQFHLRTGGNPGASAAALPATEADGKVTLAGEDIKVTFHAQGELEGAIAGMDTSVGKVALPDQNFGPATRLVRQDRKLQKLRENEIS
jgi:hypothetical protein